MIHNDPIYYKSSINSILTSIKEGLGRFISQNCPKMPIFGPISRSNDPPCSPCGQFQKLKIAENGQ